MAIRIKKEVKNKKVKGNPFYKLKYHYTIGDANGDTSETVEISVDNPYIERFVKLLNSLKSVKGTWGIILDTDTLNKFLQEQQITEDDYDFLLATLFTETDSNLEKPVYDLNNEYLLEFEEGVRSETEYSFLVFEEVTLKYVDEYGNSHKTEIVD